MLKRRNNGQYEVKNLKQAKEALESMRLLNVEIQNLMKEHGINEMMEDAAEMKKAATRWAESSGTEHIQLDGAYASLRKDKYGGTWVATDDDMDGAPQTVVPLLSILRQVVKNREERSILWKKLTTRKVNPDAVQRAVEDGTLTADQVAPAYFEKEKAAYLRVYEEK